MFKFICKRLLVSIPIFIGITLAVYIMSNMAPGNVVDQIVAASDSGMNQDQIEQLEKQYNLDKPVIVRYMLWVGDLLKGDLGTSYKTNQPVIYVLSQRIGPTLVLTITSLILALIIGIPLGIIAAYKPKSIGAWIAKGCVYFGSSMPTFFLSLCLIFLFSVTLGILPASGMYDAAMDKNFGSLIKHLVMPAFVLCFNIVGNFIKQTQGSVLEVMNEEYIKTARSKGISEFSVIILHAFRNALIPIVTQIGLIIPFLVGGAVVVEQIFAWPGIGSLMGISINSRDYPTIMGVAVLISSVVLIANIGLDILYAYIDPRISYDK